MDGFSSVDEGAHGTRNRFRFSVNGKKMIQGTIGRGRVHQLQVKAGEDE